MQVATPSRERVTAYRLLREQVEPDGRPGQRRPRRDRLPGDPLPAPVLRPGRDGGAVPGGRRHAGDAAARRHEPGCQGVRRLPVRRGRRARAVGVHRRVRRASTARSCATRTTSTG
nr:hypothetical protein [Angustibacter aerolatus]